MEERERKTATDVRPAEFVVGNDDDEFKDPEELRKVTVVREHEEENQSVHRERGVKCVCVCCGALALERNTNIEGNVRWTENAEGFRIFSVFFFTSTSEGSVPHACSEILIIWPNCSAGTFEHMAYFVVMFFARFIERQGIKIFINLTYNEPSFLAPKDAAARSPPMCGVHS